MSDSDNQSERIQFPLRAMFVLTLVAALLALLVRQVMGMEHRTSILSGAAIGFFVGFVIILVLRHVDLDCLLVFLLVIFGLVNGCWLRGAYLPYAGGLLSGALTAWRGLEAVNWLLGVCGVTVSRPRGRPPRHGGGE